MKRRQFLKAALFGTACSWAAPAWIHRGSAAPAATTVHALKCDRIPGTKFQIGGCVRRYLAGVSEQWLKIAPQSNPAMLEMFRDRDRRPLREMVPWAGEFAGKYLTSSVQILRLTGDESLKKSIADFVARLIALQAEDGYLGPWPKESRLTGHAPNIGQKGGETWDAWGHYHVMLGLLLWHEDTGDVAALRCARRVGDLFCNKFETARLVDIARGPAAPR